MTVSKNVKRGTYVRKYMWTKDGTTLEFKWTKQAEVPPLCEDEQKILKPKEGSMPWVLVEDGWKTKHHWVKAANE